MQYPNSKLKIVVILSVASILLSWNINIIPQNSIDTYEIKNDLEEMSLKGKVKSIKEISYKIFHQKGKYIKSEKGREDNSGNDKLTSFNINGNITVDIDYDSNENITSKVIYKYDSKGHKIEGVLYNSNGNIVSKSIYKNDINGNVIEYINYNPNKSINNRVTYEYDDRGNKIKDEMYLRENHKYGLFTYKYDSRGYLIEYGLYLRDANKLEDSNLYLESLAIYKNDVDGNRVETKSSQPPEKLRDELYFQYNRNEDVIDTKIYNPKGNLISRISYKYKYDEQNNWIEKAQFNNGSPMFILERKIQYYK